MIKMNNNYKLLHSEVKEKYVSVVWSHKIQEKQSDIYIVCYKIIETINILAASLTTVGVVSIIFRDELWIKIISAVLSFVTVFVGLYYKSFDLKTLAQNHKNSANKLIHIRDELRLLLDSIKMKSSSSEDLLNEFKRIIKELDEIYDDAPSTTKFAVLLARKALKINGDNISNETEINSIIPESLREIDD